jgi:exodeoxyribonuclease V beta subunit
MKDTPITPIPIQDPGQVNIDRHAVIEASAGTGKTHTIEHLVVNLLKNGKVNSLDEILVVTFTEKAAAELRDRVSKKISESLKEEWSDLLQTSLDNFDSASIFTIHGFCNKILQEYAFENGEQFQHELTDDRVIYQKLLSTIMRDIWPERYGDTLRAVLDISQFPGSTAGGNSPWIQRVIDVAIRFQPSGNDLLHPSGSLDIVQQISKTEAESRSLLDALLPLVGTIAEPDIEKSELCIRYAALNIRKISIPKRLRILSTVLRLLAAHREKEISLRQVSDFFSDIEIGEDGFSELIKGFNKSGAGEDYGSKLPRLPEIIGVLERLRLLGLPVLKNILAADTAHELKYLAGEYKKAEGLISYDDMVNHVFAALAADPGMLKHVLQRRYRYALVDEFQDTDMLQWKIFSAIFLESSENRLFIIGDPKQAIYGFRGADIHAYYTARDDMISRYRAHYYCLSENWRSSPALIQTYNRLFSDGQWFSDPAISYLPCRFPSKKAPEKHTDPRSLIIMQCGACTGNEAKFMFADFIARELISMIQENPSMVLNDIAVLVTKWKEAEAVEKSLKRANIKYSYYKKEGLYQSKESLELSYLFTAIAKTNDPAARKRALVSRFFNIPIHSLSHYDVIAPDHPVSLIFEKWSEFALTKKWPRLFQSIMDDTGILYRLDPEDYDRTVINYRSILQNLEIESYRHNFCIEEISDYLSGLRNRDSYSHDSYNIQKIDIDRPGVQILTIYASKGLEFKTVFIAGGFTRGASPDYWTYHSGGNKIFDLVRDPGRKDAYDLEMTGEEERLFYVALTRACDRLYIPLFEPTSRARGTSGILGRKLPGVLETLRNDDQVTWLESTPLQSLPVIKIGSDVRSDSTMFPDPLMPDLTLQFLDRKIYVDSFTSIKEKSAHHKEPLKPGVEFGGLSHRSGDDDAVWMPAVISPVLPDLKTELPRSRETGLMLHQVFEHVDFHTIGAADGPDNLLVQQPAISRIIETSVRDHLKLLSEEEVNSIMKETARIVWSVLHAPLNDSGLKLHGLEKRIHEVEFYYPSSPPLFPSVPETSMLNGFIHGFIDMIFIHQEKFYIVDWKSNFLEQGYTRAKLEQNILEMHYDLQIAIYTAAVIRWLKQTNAEYSYDRHFGGVFYLYLRGMKTDSAENGVFFLRPDDESQAVAPLRNWK